MSINIPVSIYCPYCHKYTALTLAPGELSEKRFPNVKAWSLWEKVEKMDRYWIGICNSCHNAVLVHDITHPFGKREIYPTPLPSPTDKRIPEHIRKDLDEAKICFSVNAYRACAVMARRAVQSTCIDKGADRNKNLVNQIEELFQKGVITKDIEEWAHTVRWIGNDAAHPESQEVAKEDAENILKLAEQFMEVIYVTSAIAKEQKTKRGK